MSGRWWERLRSRISGGESDAGVLDPDKAASRNLVPQETVPEQWLVLAPSGAVRPRAEAWLAGLAEAGRSALWSAPQEAALGDTDTNSETDTESGNKARSGGDANGSRGTAISGEAIAFDIAQWRRWLAESDARKRVVVLLAAPQCVAFAREASAAGARVVYDKPAPLLFSGPDRAFHPDDEKALVRVAQDLVAADRATTRLLADTSERLRLIHDFASAEDAGRQLPDVLAKPSLTLVVDAARDRSYLERTIEALREARGLSAYDIHVVLDPEEGAGFAELLGRETAGEIALVRDPRGPSVSGLAMAVRASSSEILVFLRSGQLPEGTDWLEGALARVQSDRQIGALALAPGTDIDGTLFRVDFEGLLLRRPAYLVVGGLDEQLGEAACAADFSMRLLTAGYRLERLPEPVLGAVPVAGTAPSGTNESIARSSLAPDKVAPGPLAELSREESRQLRRRWSDDRALLRKVLESEDG